MATESNQSRSVEISVEPCLCALSQRYRSRGLAKVVRDNAQEQILREEQTREIAPEAYRLSALSEQAVDGVWRRGKDAMDADDLVRYFSETRERRVEHTDFSVCDGTEQEKAEAGNTALTVPSKPDEGQTALRQLTAQVKSAIPAAYQRLRQGIPTWFDSSAADTSANRRGFPLSAFGAIIAIAVSLMLIVASNVMLTRAESNVSQLTVQIDELAGEVADMQSRLDVQSDLLTVRDIATGEYGMVGEEYLRMDYVSLQGEDEIEAFEEERDEAVGLAALLSAIGVK